VLAGSANAITATAAIATTRMLIFRMIFPFGAGLRRHISDGGRVIRSTADVRYLSSRSAPE
jgi:hypothetical protein